MSTPRPATFRLRHLARRTSVRWLVHVAAWLFLISNSVAMPALSCRALHSHAQTGVASTLHAHCAGMAMSSDAAPHAALHAHVGDCAAHAACCCAHALVGVPTALVSSVVITPSPVTASPAFVAFVDARAGRRLRPPIV